MQEPRFCDETFQAVLSCNMVCQKHETIGNKGSNLHWFGEHSKLNVSFKASLQAHFSTLVQSKHVDNNVGVYQESLGCVAGCFSFISYYMYNVVQ